MKQRTTTVSKSIVLEGYVWPLRIVKIGASSAAIAEFKPPTILSICWERRQILAICKMLLVDEVKDYYRIKEHCPRTFCLAIAHCQSWRKLGGDRRVRTPDGFIDIAGMGAYICNPQKTTVDVV